MTYFVCREQAARDSEFRDIEHRIAWLQHDLERAWKELREKFPTPLGQEWVSCLNRLYVDEVDNVPEM